MISMRVLDKASLAAINRYEEYEKLANNCVDDDALYGFLKGFADASNMASNIITARYKVLNDKECEDLCERIIEYAGFRCTSQRGKDGDFLKNFRKGRETGCKAAIADLKMMNIPDFMVKEGAE